MENTSLRHIVFHIIGNYILLTITYFQHMSIQPNRGQAMAISYVFLNILAIFLLSIAFILLTRKLKHSFTFYTTLIVQTIFLFYFIYRTSFYWKISNDFEFRKYEYPDLFGSGEYVMELIFGSIVLLIGFCIYKLRSSALKK